MIPDQGKICCTEINRSLSATLWDNPVGARTASPNKCTKPFLLEHVFDAYAVTYKDAPKIVCNIDICVTHCDISTGAMLLPAKADLVISFCPPSLGSNVHNQHHLQEGGDVNVGNGCSAL